MNAAIRIVVCFVVLLASQSLFSQQARADEDDAAENFNYTDDSVQAAEGDTVFFRGRNGYFGAWTIIEIEGQIGATLSGVWYFNSGGGGDFTRPVISANQPIVDAPSC